MYIKHLLLAAWREEDGVLSFEWTLLVILLVFGIVSGLCAARDGIIDELSDQAAAILSFDQSFSFSGFGPIPDSSFTDTLGVVTDCGRNTLAGQPDVTDDDS
jgi:Flp pilus assembly pilin Flp